MCVTGVFTTVVSRRISTRAQLTSRTHDATLVFYGTEQSDPVMAAFRSGETLNPKHVAELVSAASEVDIRKRPSVREEMRRAIKSAKDHPVRPCCHCHEYEDW